MSRSAWYRVVKIAQHPAFSDMGYAMGVLGLQQDRRIRGNGLPQRVKFQLHHLVMPGDVINAANNLGNPEFLKQLDSELRKRVLPIAPGNASGTDINTPPTTKRLSPASPASPIRNMSSHGTSTPLATSPAGNTLSRASNTSLPASDSEAPPHASRAGKSLSASRSAKTSLSASRAGNISSRAGNT